MEIVGGTGRSLEACLIVLLGTWSCGDGHLRGSVEPSPDGATYLVVDDDNGGGCGPILLDGVPWPHPLHTAGAVSPGLHVIECGGRIEFEIPEGTTFHFDYWGP